MFPALGLFASVRCPELSASNPGGPCKRNPCLFSHTAPPARPFAAITSCTLAGSSKTNSSISTANASGSTSKHRLDDTQSNGRPAKALKTSDVNGTSVRKPASLFTRDDEEVEDKPGASSSTRPGQQINNAGTSRIGAPRSVGASRSMQITGSGKVIRRGPAPALQTQTQNRLGTTSSSTSNKISYSSAKGKGPASNGNVTVEVRGTSSLAPGLGPPRLPINTPASYFPVATRNAMIKNIYQEFIRLYEESFSPKERQRLAAEHSLAQEAIIYSKNNKFSYRTACIAIIARLKKRAPAEGPDEIGTMEDYDKHLKELSEQDRNRLTVAKTKQLTMDRAAMIAHDYVVDVPAEEGGTIPTEEGGHKKCERCNADYIVHGNMTEAEKTACVYHWGRMEMKPDRSRRWNCCQANIDGTGCTRGPHVFIEKTAADLHKRAAFMRSDDLPAHEGYKPLKIAALDCELIRTTAGMTLARLTIVDADGEEKFDEFIKPTGLVVDLVTRWSGVTEEDLTERARLDFAKLRKDSLGKYINEKTILIGHGLENDLKALRLVHPPGRVIDTAQLYPHPKGLPYRRALRFLVQEVLGIFIQDGGSTGHSSLIDARAALDLVKAKAAKLTEMGKLNT